jgi:hypothetical protein
VALALLNQHLQDLVDQLALAVRVQLNQHQLALAVLLVLLDRLAPQL